MRQTLSWESVKERFRDFREIISGKMCGKLQIKVALTKLTAGNQSSPCCLLKLIRWIKMLFPSLLPRLSNKNKNVAQNSYFRNKSSDRSHVTQYQVDKSMVNISPNVFWYKNLQVTWQGKVVDVSDSNGSVEREQPRGKCRSRQKEKSERARRQGRPWTTKDRPFPLKRRTQPVTLVSS